MSIKSINKYYILGIIPLITIDFTLLLILVYKNEWIFYPVLMAGVLIIYQFIKKFSFMPRPLKEYKDLKKIKLKLPIHYDVEYFSSQDLDKYSFLVRIVEVLSPLYLKRGEKIKVVVSEKILKTQSPTFVKIAVCREIEKYRTKSLLKIILVLVVPILTIISIVLLGMILKINLLTYFNPFVAYFLLPFFAVVLLVAYLFFWNQYISNQETKLDAFLTSYFRVEDVEKYINQIEKLEGGVENSKYQAFNNYYAKQRIKKLKSLD